MFTVQEEEDSTFLLKDFIVIEKSTNESLGLPGETQEQRKHIPDIQ
jgi:hypothetical protein